MKQINNNKTKCNSYKLNKHINDHNDHYKYNNVRRTIKNNKNIVYNFNKNNYNFKLKKYKNTLGITYSLNHKYIKDINIPSHLCNIYNQNYINNILLKIIKNTDTIHELNYQWTNISNIINNTYMNSNTDTFSDNIIKFINNIKDCNN